MPSPSNIEFDSSIPDASATPSISKQPTTTLPSAGIEYDPSNTQSKILATLGQLTTLLSLSSIEYDSSNTRPKILSTSRQLTTLLSLSSIQYDPNNPPSKTSSTSKQEPVGRKSGNCCPAINTKLPEWKRYLLDFLSQLCTFTNFAIKDVKFWPLLYVIAKKRFYFLSAHLMFGICLYFIRRWIISRAQSKRDKGRISTKPEFVLKNLGTTYAGLLKRAIIMKIQMYLELFRKIEQGEILPIKD